MLVLKSFIIVGFFTCAIADSLANSNIAKNIGKGTTNVSVNVPSSAASATVTQSSKPTTFNNATESVSADNTSHIKVETAGKVVKPLNNNSTKEEKVHSGSSPHTVPKKGVYPDVEPHQNANASLVSSSNSSEPTKPSITEADNAKFNETVDNLHVNLKLDARRTNPAVVVGQKSRTDYIIPIVAVIMSVPLVAILISLAYKRSTDWWQHRNYKRMDFLIEGLYHD